MSNLSSLNRIRPERVVFCLHSSGSKHPNLLLWIVLLHNLRRVTSHHRIGRYATTYYRIRADDRALSDNQFAFTAQNRCSETNPAPFFYSDSSARRHRLTSNGNSYIFERVVVIHNEDRRRKNGIPHNTNLVFRRDYRSSSDPTAIFYDNGRSSANGHVRDVQPDLPPKLYPVTEPNVICSGPLQIAGVVHRNVFANRSERIRPDAHRRDLEANWEK